MKKTYLFATTVLALASCSIDEYSPDTGESRNGEILFAMKSNYNTRAKAGKEAADLLGGNFIVEGIKGTEATTSWTPTTVVFDNYLVSWEQNSAGTSADNTNDWKYVGVTGTTNVPAATLTNLGRDVDQQSIKYWDYSAPKYAFMALSTGTLNTVAGSAEPVSSTSVHVTKIASTLPGDNTVSYAFKAKSAADFAKCYYTDVTPVVSDDYGKPVVLKFKNLAAKVRVGLYETIPGYSVKDVQFYSNNTLSTDNIWTDVTSSLTVGNAFPSGTDYYTENEGVYTKVTSGNVLADTKYYTLSHPSDPSAGNDATLFLSSGNFPEDGTITVSYPLVGTDNASKNGYNKADVAVTGTTVTTTTTKTFGALTNNYVVREHKEDATATPDKLYLGRTLATATMAGSSTDNFYMPVIPVSTGAALTLRCNYTLVSTDGSGEEIKVWGAKAVVPANYCEWQPNYAYTYIFKISDNTNGSTEKLGGTPEGLFPITFDAVVADITDASAEQTTVTTVATPSVTTYQYGHKQGEEYKAGDIYVMSMKDGSPQTITGALIYTATDDHATEADVIDALQMGTTATNGDVTGRNGLVLTKTTLLATDVTTIPAVDGTNMTVASGTAGKFTAAASTNYVFVYDYTTGNPTASVLYSYEAAASTTEPSDWATTYTSYYTKTVDASGNIVYTPATATWATGTSYYKKYENNNHTYAVKVIKTGTTY